MLMCQSVLGPHVECQGRLWYQTNRAGSWRLLEMQALPTLAYRWAHCPGIGLAWGTPRLGPVVMPAPSAGDGRWVSPLHSKGNVMMSKCFSRALTFLGLEVLVTR